MKNLVEKFNTHIRLILASIEKREYNVSRKDAKKEGSCMLSAVDAGKYIVNYSNDIGYPISNLKLQKLLYYTQAATLVELGKPWFDGDITCWKYGPVSVEAYKYFSAYGSDAIEYQVLDAIVYDSKKNALKYTTLEIENTYAKIVEGIVTAYKEITNPFMLMKRTHDEAPWKDAENNEIITQSSIKSYFENNLERLYNKTSKGCTNDKHSK